MSISHNASRPSARELGLVPGILPTGPLNAITDVAGVKVGHVTLIDGDAVCTGATAIVPHGGNVYLGKLPAGVVVGNGHGKMMGSTQVEELGEIETPIVLTNTLSVPRAADAILDWTLAQPGNESAVSINPIVGETNDSCLNDIRLRALTPDIIRHAIETARDGPVEEGVVGAGTGTVAFGWKGGIGTSSRTVPEKLGGYTVGVLVQSNFGGVLQVCGVPVGLALGQHYLSDRLDRAAADGSIMIVIATDAPLSDRNLTRLAWRGLAGLARTGASMSSGSGDYAIAFSTAEGVRRMRHASHLQTFQELANEGVSPLFQAAIEVTEEAIYNSLFKARTITGRDQVTVEALPVERVLDLIWQYRGALL